MKRLATLVLLLSLAGAAQGQTLASDLVTLLRLRTGERDTVASYFTNEEALLLLNSAQDRVVTLGGLLEKSYDTTYQRADSLGVTLPSTYRFVTEVKTYLGKTWQGIKPNPSFADPTSDFCYDVDWYDADSARIMFRGDFMQGVRLRITYLGVAESLDALTDTVQVRSDQEGLIVEEAMRYYLESLSKFQAAAQMQMGVRADIGVGQKK
jgi:hypothetical protein